MFSNKMQHVFLASIHRTNFLPVAFYRITPIETENKITVPHSMIKNIEKQRAKKIYRQEKQEDPPGDRTRPALVACKRPAFNHFPGRQYQNITPKHVASNAWLHRLSKGDFFTVDYHSKNPSWTESPVQTFEQLQCRPELIETLQHSKIHQPTSTQAQAIPILRTGRHTSIAAQTGSGKTLAYLVPLIESFFRWKSSNRLLALDNAPFAIVLAPTRELVLQIQTMFNIFQSLNIRVESLVGINIDRDPLNFTLGQIDFLIATPGILLRLLRQDEHFGIARRLIGTNLRHMVVDEADTLLDMTFSPAIVEIIRRLQIDVQPVNNEGQSALPAVQLVFVSATVPRSTEEILGDLIGSDQIQKTSTTHLHRLMPHVPQRFYRIGQQQKLNLLLKLVKSDLDKKHPCLIFANQTKVVRFLEKFFKDQRIEVVTMHKEMTDTKRRESLQKFQSGETLVMCATDIISRGLDTSWVEHVIQFDFPRFISDYIHRAGRVGRVGSKRVGKVSSFVTQPHEIQLAQHIEVAARLNKKLSGVNNDIKKQLLLQGEKRERQQEKVKDRQAREQLCHDVIRSAMN